MRRFRWWHLSANFKNNDMKWLILATKLTDEKGHSLFNSHWRNYIVSLVNSIIPTIHHIQRFPNGFWVGRSQLSPAQESTQYIPITVTSYPKYHILLSHWWHQDNHEILPKSHVLLSHCQHQDNHDNQHNQNNHHLGNKIHQITTPGQRESHWIPTTV